MLQQNDPRTSHVGNDGITRTAMSEREQEGEIVEPMKMVSIPLLSLAAIIPKNGENCHSSIAACGNEKNIGGCQCQAPILAGYALRIRSECAQGPGQDDGGRRG